MSSSFADLKRSRKTSLKSLISESNKLDTPSNKPQEDTRFWKPDVDKAGNGYAVIRFLPPVKEESMPWIRIYNHGFQGPGGWYIEDSLTSINKKDPVSEHNSMLWNSGIESNKDLVRKQKRRLTYTSNIYVVKDPTRPENEGKVFLYKYGKKIWDKLNSAMNPEFEADTPFNPFDFWEGANFKLKIRQVAGYRNYDSSEFETPGPLLDNDDELEVIWDKQHSLDEFMKPENFKSYDELKAKLDRVLGLASSNNANPNAAKSAEEVAAPSQPKSTPSPKMATASAEDDDDMSFFEKLAED